MTALENASARARHAASQLRCTRAEALAVGVLVAGALVALGLLWLAAPPGADPAPAVSDQADGAGLVVDRPGAVVHVSGQVGAPGLHRLPADARVADAIDAAGGPTAQAHLDALNLARPLKDGEQLHVPSGAEVEAAGTASGGTSASAIQADGTLDLNSATAAELEELPGIGPVLAGRIVDHRETHGPFTSVGDLRQVTGVGEKIFQALAELLSV